MIEDDFEPLYKVAEAAKMLCVSPLTVRRWEKAGKIKAIRSPSGYRMIPLSEIKRIREGK